MFSALGARGLWNAPRASRKKGGEGIRTPETLAGLSDFKSDAFNRSATPPKMINNPTLRLNYV